MLTAGRSTTRDAISPLSYDLSERSYRTLLGCVICLAAFVRLWHLGTRGLIIDEGYSWAVSRAPLPTFLRELATNNGEMPMHYILLRYWSLLGTSESVMRTLSVLFALGTVPVVAEIGRRLYSRRAGLYAAALFAVQVVAIKYSQEIRTYPMVMFFAALGWLMLTSVARDPTRPKCLWFGLVSVATIYSHLIGGFNVAAQFATMMFLPRSTLGWRKIAESTLAIVVGIFPLILFTLNHTNDVAWIHPTDGIILREFFANLGGRFELVAPVVAPWLLFAGVLALFGATWKRTGTSRETWIAAVPVLGTAVPFLLLLAVAHFKPLFIPRYIAYAIVPFLLGIGWLLSRLKPMPGAAVVLGLMATFAMALPSYYQEPAWMDFRGGAAYIAERRQPGDALVVWEPMARPAVEYYGSRVQGFPEFIFPNSGDHFHASDMFMTPDPYTLPSIFAQRKRIWIVFDIDKSPEEYNVVPPLFLERVIGRTHKMISFRQFQNVRVEEFEKTDEQSTNAN